MSAVRTLGATRPPRPTKPPTLPPPVAPRSWRVLARPEAWPFFALPLGLLTQLLPAQRGLALTSIVAVGLVFVAWGLIKRGQRFPREARGWHWFAASFVLYAVIYASYVVRLSGGRADFPGPVEMLTVPATLCQVVSLLSFPVAAARPGARLRTAMDAVTFALAMICLQWLGGVAELSSLSTMSAAERVYAATPFMTLALTTGMLVYLASAQPERYLGVLGLLFIAAVLGSINNLAALSMSLAGVYEFGHPVDLLAAGALFFLAAVSLWPHPIDRGAVRASFARVPAYVPYLPVVAVLAVLLERHATGRLGVASNVLWLVYPLLGVVILRQYLTLMDLRRMSATLETQVERRTRALAAARDELLGTRRLEALGSLAGGVAHDFNDLLTGIGGHAHLIARTLPAGDPAAGYALEVQRAVERGAGLTRQILTFARRQAGEPRVFAAAELVAGLERLLGRLVDERTELVVRTEAEDARLHMDPGQLEQVVVNLVVNARDAMPQGGRIVVATSLVEVTVAEAAAHGSAPGTFVALAVEDSGEGMTPQVRARVFEPFFTTKAPGKGTGLGLATCYGIVSHAGGFITVTSEPGRGSTFVVHLPLTCLALTAAAEAGPRSTPSAGRVLLVDASPLLRATLAEALRAGGFEVRDAASGSDAADALQRGAGAIDVLVTDTLVPGLAVRTILTSGYLEHANATLPAHVALPAKPFLPDELVRKIGQAMETP